MPKRPVFDRCVHVVQSIGIWNFYVQAMRKFQHVTFIRSSPGTERQMVYTLLTEAGFAVALGA